MVADEKELSRSAIQDQFRRCPRYEPCLLAEQTLNKIEIQVMGAGDGPSIRSLVGTFAKSAETDRVRLEGKIRTMYVVGSVVLSLLGIGLAVLNVVLKVVT